MEVVLELRPGRIAAEVTSWSSSVLRGVNQKRPGDAFCTKNKDASCMSCELLPVSLRSAILVGSI